MLGLGVKALRILRGYIGFRVEALAAGIKGGFGLGLVHRSTTREHRHVRDCSGMTAV